MAPNKKNVSARERDKILFERKKRQFVALIENIKETQRELDRFVVIAKRLKDKLGEISLERRNELELESWREKARRMAAVEIMTMGRPSKSTMDFILSLPQADMSAILIELKSAKPEKILRIG